MGDCKYQDFEFVSKKIYRRSEEKKNIKDVCRMYERMTRTTEPMTFSQ